MRPSRLLRGVGLPAALCVAILTGCAGDVAGVNCGVTGIPVLTIGVNVSGAMEDGDCTVEGDPGDVYRLALTTTTLFSATVSSDKFSSQMYIEKNLGSISSDAEVAFESGKPAKLNALLPAGEYIFEVQSDENAKGSYTISTKTLDGSGCPASAGFKVYTVTGLGITGAIAPGDCQTPSGGFATDGYFMKLKAGTAYSASVNSSMSIVHLEFAKEGVVVAGSGQQSNTGKQTITYTPTVTGYYLLSLVSLGAVNGPYTITVTP